MRRQLLRQRRYLRAMVDRMAALRWRRDDPMWGAAHAAARAVDELLKLCVVTRRSGGRLP